MMFLLRAAFWLAIVSFFVPRDFAGDAIPLPAMQDEPALVDAGQALTDWCEEREAICEAGEEAVRLGGFLADFAAERVEAALEERDASAEASSRS